MAIKAILVAHYIKSKPHLENLIRYMDRQSPVFDQRGHDLPVEEAVYYALQPTNGVVWRMEYSPSYEECLRHGLYALDPEVPDELCRSYMQDLVAASRVKIAKVYNISPENLRVIASWHHKEGQPHLHLVCFSTSAQEGYIRPAPGQTNDQALNVASNKVKSLFTNQIFDDATLQDKVNKGRIRDNLNLQLRDIVKSSYCVDPYITSQLRIIGQEMKGRAFYSYQTPDCRARVDRLLEYIVDKEPTLYALFESYAQVQGQLTQNYAKKNAVLARKGAEWQQQFFHPLTAGSQNARQKTADVSRHNIILQAAKEMAAQSSSANLSIEPPPFAEPDSEPNPLRFSSGSFPPSAPETHLPNESDSSKAHLSTGDHFEYHLGEFFSKSDPHRAILWYNQGIAKDDVWCHYGLGRLYDHPGLYRNPARAAQCYKEGCNAGHIPSAYRYAIHLATGSGVERDTSQAQRLFEWILDSDDPSAAPYKEWAGYRVEWSQRQNEYRVKSTVFLAQKMLFQLGRSLQGEDTGPVHRVSGRRGFKTNRITHHGIAKDVDWNESRR